MFAFPILTCISGFASFGMLLLFVDEIFKKINNKIASLKEENRVLTAELKTLKSENNELVDKIKIPKNLSIRNKVNQGSVFLMGWQVLGLFL